METENNTQVENTVEEVKTNTNEGSGNNAVITAKEFEAIKKKELKKGRLQGALVCIFAVILCSLAVWSFKVVTKTVVDTAVQSIYPEKQLITESSEKKINTLWGMIDKYFLWETDEDKVLTGAYKGMFESLDDIYSCYYTKEEFDSIMESSSGKYSGIGAYVTTDAESGISYVSKPMPGSPAEESGVRPNDYIYEIDGEDVRGLELNVVVSKIKGPEHSKVVIGFKREGVDDLVYIEIERRTIEVDMLEYSMLEDGIGYIFLYEFEQLAVEQFDKAYADLESQGMEGLIIDLRDNPGGDLDAVIKLADEFLDEGTIVYTKDKNGNGETYKSDANAKNIPLVILTNGNSASASEILSGSLHDRGVATIVGTKTFGKGIVQGLMRLPDGSGLKITESEYYLPNDECIHGVGINPDIEIELDVDNYREKGIDNQKIKAVEVLKEKMKK